MQAEQGDLSAAQYAEIYVQWNQPEQALNWLEKAYALHDTGLDELKVDPSSTRSVTPRGSPKSCPNSIFPDHAEDGGD